MPDFIVPEHIFTRSTRVQWFEGLRVTVPYNEPGDEDEVIFKSYSGKVKELSNSIAEWQQSPWEALVIEWDTSDSNESGEQPVTRALVDQEGEHGDPETKEEMKEGAKFERFGPWEVVPELHADSTMGKSIRGGKATFFGR